MQESRCGGSRLLLPGPAEVRPGGGLHRPGHRPSLPPLYLERLLSKTAVRVNASAADGRSLPRVQRHGAEPQRQLVSGGLQVRGAL